MWGFLAVTCVCAESSDSKERRRVGVGIRLKPQGGLTLIVCECTVQTQQRPWACLLMCDRYIGEGLRWGSLVPVKCIGFMKPWFRAPCPKECLTAHMDLASERGGHRAKTTKLKVARG